MPAPAGAVLGIGSMTRDTSTGAVGGQGRGPAPARSGAQRSPAAALEARRRRWHEPANRFRPRCLGRGRVRPGSGPGQLWLRGIMGGGARRLRLPAPPLGGQGLLCFERAVCLVLAHLQAEAPARQDWASGAFDLDDGVAALAPTGAPDLGYWLWTMWVERRPHTTRTRPCRGPDRVGRPGGRLDHDLRPPRPSLAGVGAGWVAQAVAGGGVIPVSWMIPRESPTSSS